LRAAPAKKRRLSTATGISSSRNALTGLPALATLERHELLGALLDRVGDPQKRE
jgi:hypothetical protein